VNDPPAVGAAEFCRPTVADALAPALETEVPLEHAATVAAESRTAVMAAQARPAVL
jgi:hypothetical protein